MIIPCLKLSRASAKLHASFGARPWARYGLLAGAVCVLGVTSAFLFGRLSAKGAGDADIIAAREMRQVFTPGGVKQEIRPARIFVIKSGKSGRVIQGFNAANHDKLRIQGFGLTKPEDVKSLMRQTDGGAVLSLPGGVEVVLSGVSMESLPASSFQLELDRSALVETFADDFNSFSWYAEGLSPREDRRGTWRTNYGWGPPTAEASRSLPGESQVYADHAFKGTAPDALGLNPFHLTNNILEIWGEPAPDRVLPFIWGRRYISGLITTKRSFSQLYGVFEMRARLPKGRGFWPAFWLLPVDSSWPPEIDVFEVLGHDPAVLYANAHSKAGGEHTSEGVEISGPDLSADFHLYAVEWQKDEIRWYLDGVEIARAATPADAQKPMYLLANLAVGGNWPGQPDSSTQFPGILAIDYIRAYRRKQTQPAR